VLYEAMLFSAADWSQIEHLRTKIARCSQASICDAASDFAALFIDEFETAVLARVFAVLPFQTLPERDQQFAIRRTGGDPRLSPTTPVLSLLGTRGHQPELNDRLASREHLAVPLLDRSFVQGAPMIAKLLSDLAVDLKWLDSGQPITTRRMEGSRNGTFYVPDALTAQDEHGRKIIPAQTFVRSQGIRTVFGMGGAYVDGTWVIAIVFTRELLERLVVDRFPSLISNFKMATAKLQATGRVF
jgi:hypothetical protein